MQCNYNSFIQIINFHGWAFLQCSEVPKNWCLSNTGALTVHKFRNIKLGMMGGTGRASQLEVKRVEDTSSNSGNESFVLRL